MKKTLLYCCVGWLACLQSNAAEQLETDEIESVAVILKLDDMVQREGAIPAKWQRVYEFAGEKGIPFSAGIIGNSLEDDAPEYFEGLIEWDASGNVELWNHGYDHKQWTEDGQKIREFQGSGYEHQIDHLKRSQELGEEKIGVTFVSFGAPYNATDSDTQKSLSEIPELKVWLYGERNNSTGMTVLRRNYKINLEAKTGQLVLEQFEYDYSSNNPGKVLVLQGHPMLWDDQEFEVFKEIIAFLESQNVHFVLPRDYANTK